MAAQFSNSPYPFPQIDQEQARRQLSYFNYKPGENVNLRLFYHSNDPRKDGDKGRKLDRLRWKDVKNYQRDGRGVYVVVNGAGGGHEDRDIKQCVAIFCEWDDRPVEDQLLHWETVGFLEPTFTVYSGDKSAQPYWVFDEPITVEQWRELQCLLIEVMGADPANKNPSRVFRLAGGWHVKPGREPQRTEIVQDSGIKYSYEKLRDRLLELKALVIPTSLPLQPPLKELESAATPDIVEVINEYIPLRQSGADWIGDCPFCGAVEQFIVKPRHQAFECFSCKSGGDADNYQNSAADFLKKHRRTFSNASQRIRYKDITVPVPESVPLEVCLSKDSRHALREGVSEGGRNDNGAKLARDIIGTANYLQSIGQRFNGDPWQLFLDYCHRCPSGKGWAEGEWKNIWKSAEGDRPTPSCKPEGVDNCIRGWYWNNYVLPNLPKRDACGGSVSDHRTLDFTPHHSGKRGGSGGGDDGGNALSSVTLEQRIDEILDRNLDESDEDAAFLHLSKAYGTTKRDIADIAKKRIEERELTDNRSERLQELEALENLEKGKINLERVFYRKPAVGKALKQLCKVRSLRAEYFLGILPIAAMLSGTGTTLKITQDFIVPTVLNIGLVGESSDRKSVVSNLLMNPMRRIQSEMYELHKKQKADYEKAVANWMLLNPKTRGPSPREDEFVTVPDTPLVVTEQTREGLVKAHEKNRNGLLLYKAELASVSKGFNIYRGGRGDDEEFFNNLWDGDEITRVLASQETIRISKTCIPQFGGIQPDVLLNLMDMNDPNGRWARYLWILCPLEKRKTSFLDPVVDVSPMLYSIYSRMMHAPKMEHVLSREALVLFDQQNQLYEELQFSNPQAGMRALYGKIPGMIARIALNLHRLNAAAAGVDPELEIPIEAVQVAIEVVQFCLGQLTIIRAMGEASVDHEYGLTAVYRQIQKLATRLVGKEQVLTARMVLSARLPVFQGKKASNIVKIFKDMAAMGKAELVRVKRSLGLLVSSVIGGSPGSNPGGNPSGNPGGNPGGNGNHPSNPPITPVNPAEVIAEFAEDLLKTSQELEPNEINTSSRSAELLNLLKDGLKNATPPSVTVNANSANSAQGENLIQTGVQQIQQSSANTQQTLSKSPDANSANNTERVAEKVWDCGGEWVTELSQPTSPEPIPAPACEVIVQPDRGLPEREKTWKSNQETLLPGSTALQNGNGLNHSGFTVPPATALPLLDPSMTQMTQTDSTSGSWTAATTPSQSQNLEQSLIDPAIASLRPKGFALDQFQQPSAPAAAQPTTSAPAAASSSSTQLKVGSAVALADPYTVAYTYHGIVEEVAGDEILVRWAERQEKANECEVYHASELRQLE